MKLNLSKQTTKILSILLISIGLMLSGNVFAADSTPNRVTQPEFNAAIANLQAQIDKLTPPVVRAIGDVLPDNSIVFWVDETGQHGFAAWPVDDADSNWYIAKEHAENHGSGWRLPTKYELNLLYQQKDVVGGFAADYYWSSTEGDADMAWMQIFNLGAQGHDSKGNPNNRVRAIRAF
jgi:hypothetical protein